MWTSGSALMHRLTDWANQFRTRFLQWSPQAFGHIPIEVLLAMAVPIAVEVLPTTGNVRAILLAVLCFIVADLVSRATPIFWGKCVAVTLAIIATLVVGYPRVDEQLKADAVLRDYKTTRDLAAKYAAHDKSLKRVVAHYDQLRTAQSLFGGSIASITTAEIEDVKNVLNNIEAIATPFGKALQIKLAQNFYRVLYPGPMRITPQISITGLPSGVTSTIINSTNLGFTVLFSPLSNPVDHFGISASAEP